MKQKSAAKRRIELWLISGLTFLSSSGALLVVAFFMEQRNILLISMGILSLLSGFYVIEKEARLQKETFQLRDDLQQEQMKVLEEQVEVSLLNNKVKELTDFYRALEAINLKNKPETTLQTLLSSSLDLFKTKQGVIMLVDDKTQSLMTVSIMGVKKDDQSFTRSKIGESPFGYVAQSGNPLLLVKEIEEREFKSFFNSHSEILSIISVPLKIRDKIIGVLSCSKTAEAVRPFSEYELKLLSIFGQYASIVIENAQLIAHEHKAVASSSV